MGQEVENVCLTRVAFWDRGTEFMDEFDFAETDLRQSGVHITLQRKDGFGHMEGAEFQIACRCRPVRFSIEGRVKEIENFTLETKDRLSSRTWSGKIGRVWAMSFAIAFAWGNV